MIFVNDLEVGYDRQAVAMPLNGQFCPGSLTAVIGANGAGKSTFLKTLAGLQQAVAGNITFTGGKRPRLAYCHSRLSWIAVSLSACLIWSRWDAGRKAGYSVA